jgi:hypothetical protein
MVVLHELRIDAGGLPEGAPVVTLEEESAVVAEDPGLEEEYVRNCGGGDFHG